MKSANATKATVMVAYKGYKRFADSELLTKPLKDNCHVIDRTESPAEIFKRFGAFSDLKWKQYRDNINKKRLGYWDNVDIFLRTNAPSYNKILVTSKNPVKARNPRSAR